MEEQEQKKRGRPRAKEARSTVSSWILAKHHEQLAEVARRNSVSVSEHVRRILVLSLQDQEIVGK